MQDIQYHLLAFWAPALFYCMALWLTISITQLRGKGWLIAFLVTKFVYTACYYVLQELLRNEKLTTDQYRDFVAFGGLPVVNILSYAVLVVFVLAMTPLMGANERVSSMLFSLRGRLTRQLFWIVSITLGTVNIFIASILSGSIASPGGTNAWAIAPLVTYILLLLA